MNGLYNDFYNDMKVLLSKIELECNIEDTIKSIDTNAELLDYVECIINKNGGRRIFTKLWSKGRLDLSLENLILKEKYRSVFDETIRNRSIKTLSQYGYEVE